MLVGIRRRDDAGAVLVTVLVVMLVLGIAALTLAAVVTNTSRGLTGSRDTAQSRTSADAGLAAAVAQARRTGAFCGITLTSTTPPKYTATSVCTGSRVTFTSVGSGSGSARTTTSAVYEFAAGQDEGAGDMVFFGSTTFSREVLTHSLDGDLLSIVIPTGSFTCMAPVPANIVVAGDFVTQGNCTVGGSVITGGVANMTNGPDTVKGSLTSSGTGTNTVRGSVGGDLTTRGPIEFGWETKTITGNASSTGNVSLGSVRIQKSLTLPSAKTLNTQSGVVSGGINRPASVTAPTAPSFDSWFDYGFSLADWQPYGGLTYAKLTLVNSGSGPGTCSYYNSWPATGWTALASLTSPVILDARACSSLSSNSGTSPVVALKTNVVLLAKSYDLTTLTFKGATGYQPRVWFVVEDATKNASPTCSGGAGNITINGTVMSENITAMAYTPCTINVQGQTVDSWRGAFYGGSFNYGGGLSFYGDPIVLPGMPAEGLGANLGTTAASLGALVSRGDVP